MFQLLIRVKLTYKLIKEVKRIKRFNKINFKKKLL